MAFRSGGTRRNENPFEILERIRFLGIRTSVASDPPLNTADMYILDTGVVQEFRIRYNDNGTIRTGAVSLL